MLDDAPAAEDNRPIAERIASANLSSSGDRPKPPAVKAPTNIRRVLVVVAGIAALSLAGYYLWSYWTIGRFMVSTDDAYVGGRAATLSPKVAGYITEIAVADNASVKAGDLIARIDPGDYDLAVRAARDQVETQRSTIARIGKQVFGQQAVVAQSKAQAASARAGFTRADLELHRQTDLAQRGINSAQALEQAKAARDQAVAAVDAADAATASATATVAVFEAQRTEAENTLKQNETMLAKAERDLTFAEIRAPFAGVIGNRAIQVGDYVQPAQRLASLVPLQSVYIDANFKETQISRLQPGQPVTITVDAQAGKTFDGVIESVAPASGSVFSLLPPDNATGNFTKVVQRLPVRIGLPASVTELSILRPGMSVFASVNTKPGAANSLEAKSGPSSTGVPVAR